MNNKHYKNRCILAVMLLCMFFSFELLAQNVKFTFKNTPIKTILADVSEKTGFKFVYSNELQQIDNKVDFNLDADKGDINSILKNLFANTPVSWKINGNQVVIAPSEIISQNSGKQNQDSKFSGKISDGASGETIPGVAVKNLRTNEVVVANDMGEFSIGAQQGDVLAFTSIGMKDVNFTVTRTDKIASVVMEMDLVSLEDVVVTGYQTISKERSAGSYNIIKGSDVVNKAISRNSIVDGLEGMTTGLSINNGTYRVRGTSSINSNQSPLFVIDGVAMTASRIEDLISSNDISNITVLKDATAASIWGSQAANGVVVITTKRGQNKEKLRISYNGSFTYYGKPDYDYYNYMDSQTWMKNAQEMFDMYSETYKYENLKSARSGTDHALNSSGSGIPVIWPHEEAMYKYKEGLISQTERDSYLASLVGLDGRGQFEEYFMSDKMYTSHTVSLNGGSDKHTYYVSLNYKGDQGISQDWENKFSINATQDFQITPWLKWDITLNSYWAQTNAHVNPFHTGTPTPTNTVFQTYSGARYYPLPYNIFVDENGDEINQSAMIISEYGKEYAEDLTGINLDFYPLQDWKNSTRNDVASNIRVNTGFNVSLFKGLRYEGRFQYNRFNSKTETFRDANTYIVREERMLTYDTANKTLRVPKTGGHFTVGNTLASDWTLRNQLVYDSSFNNKKHQVTALMGTELRESKSTTYTSYARGYNIQTMIYEKYDINAVSGNISKIPFGSTTTILSSTYGQSETTTKYFSLYANAAYTYDNKYTLNASLRMDQSNLFGSNPANQYKPIWSVGGAWQIAKEEFMSNCNFFNQLTLRASFGYAGNSPDPGTGGTYDILKASTSVRFETPVYKVDTPANDMLIWEKTRIVNIGFDTQFLKNAIALSFDYYNKYTTDLISTVTLNPTTGFFSALGNIGELSNKGFEFTLTTNNFRREKFTWQTMLTFSYNKNKVEKVVRETPIQYADQLVGTQTALEGYPMYSLFSYRYAGLTNEGMCAAYDKEGNIVSAEDVAYLTKDDAVHSGTTVPPIFGGLTNRFSFNNFELSFMFVYNFGAKMREDGIYFYGRPGAHLLSDFDKRWRKPGDEEFTDIPKYTVTNDKLLKENVYKYADTRILDASYIKLRDLTLSYTLPSRICQKIKTKNISVTATVGNLFCIPFNSKGIDPEAYSFGNGSYNARGEKYGPSYTIGLNINL